MSGQEYKNITVKAKVRSNTQVDLVAFEHELTQIYLELKNTFTPEFVAQNAPLLEIDKEILQPNTEWCPAEIEMQLPESIHVSFCDVKNCDFDNKLEEIRVKTQKIYRPNTSKTGISFSQDYNIEYNKISLANTDLNEIKTEKVKKYDFTLVVPSIQETNQETEFENLVEKEKITTPKISDVPLKDNNIHIDADKLASTYIKPNISKPNMEFSQDYNIEYNKISLANTDLNEIKTEKVKKYDFTLVVPSIQETNQETEFENLVEKEKIIKPKIANVLLKENNIHIDGDEPIFKYTNLGFSSVETEFPLFSLEDFKCKTVDAKVTTINDSFFELSRCVVGLHSANISKLVDTPNTSNLSNTKIKIISFLSCNFDDFSIQKANAKSDDFEFLNTELIWNEINNSLNLTLDTLNSDL